MRHTFLFASHTALVLCGFLTIRGQWSTQWSAPDTVADGLRMPLDLQVVVDSQGRVHALCSEDFDGDWWPEGICHWVKDDGKWQRSTPFVHDSILCVDMLAATADDQDMFHLLWGISKTHENLGHSNEVFWSSYQGGIWAPATLLRRAICYTLRLVSLPGQRLLAAWAERDPSTSFEMIHFARRSEGRWHPPVIALKYFWPGSSPQCEPTLVAGPDDTIHLAFLAWRQDWYTALFYACRPWDGPWSSLAEVYFHRQFSYTLPVLALTKDGYRHLFWAVDLDPDFEMTPDCLYYSFSHDGRSWSPPRMFSHFTPQERWSFHEAPIIAADSAGLLHAVWAYRGREGSIYFYRCGREESWSEAMPIFSESVHNGHQALTIDRENRLHLLWVTVNEANPDFAVLRHAVGEIHYGTGVTFNGRASAHDEPLVEVRVYPNPINERAILQLLPSEPCVVTVTIYDTVGRLVQRLLEEKLVTCNETLIWSAGQEGSSLPSGMYFYRLVAASATRGGAQYEASGKLLLVR